MTEIVKDNHSFNLESAMGQKVEKQPDVNSVYAIDFSMIESVNDLVIILASMGMAIQGNHPHIEQLKRFIDLDKPISVRQEAPKERPINLPKLKNIDGN